MQDRVPTPGQEGRVLITPESGEPFYAKIEMADNPSQTGTAFIKQNMLKDATALLYGFTEDQLAGVVPDAVLSILSKAAIFKDGGLETAQGTSIPAGRLHAFNYVPTGETTVTQPLPFTPNVFCYYSVRTFVQQGTTTVDFLGLIFRGYDTQILFRAYANNMSPNLDAMFVNGLSGVIGENQVQFDAYNELNNTVYSGNVYCFAIA